MSHKARNLELLRDRGIAVPRGFVLDASHFDANVGASRPVIAAWLHEPRGIEGIFMALPLANETRDYVRRELGRFADSTYFAVRSCGAVVAGGVSMSEDGSAVSLAGQFESYLVVPKARVLDAVRGCWASLFNPRSVARFGSHSDYLQKSSMSVLIQEMIPAAASAVMMTVDPQGDGRAGAIELTLGACQAIVAGVTSPDEVAFSRVGGTIFRTDIGAKEHRVEYAVYGARDSNVLILPNGVDRFALAVDLATLRALVRLGYEIESVFGTPQDIELVISPDGRVVVTQARPITTTPPTTTHFTLLNAA